MKATFIGQDVEVKFETRPGPPSAFVWKGVEYRVTAVESERTVLDFQKDWWRRRHRDEVTVRTESGEIFKLRAYRKSRKREWVLYEKIEE
jgi:hypothetical protein